MAKLRKALQQAGIWIHTRSALRDPVTKLPQQTGALPWRRRGKRLQVLLVTGRVSKRWSVPKGWPMFGKTLAEAAAREAYEEAGVKGTAEEQPIGRFDHRKTHSQLGALDVTILVHALEVKQSLSNWPEKAERARRWLDIDKAAELVENAQLREVLLGFAATVRRH